MGQTLVETQPPMGAHPLQRWAVPSSFTSAVTRLLPGQSDSHPDRYSSSYAVVLVLVTCHAHAIPASMQTTSSAMAAEVFGSITITSAGALERRGYLRGVAERN